MSLGMQWMALTVLHSLAHTDDECSSSGLHPVVLEDSSGYGPSRYEGPPWSCYGDGFAMYGAGHVWTGRANFYLHDHELSRSLS